MSEWVDYLVAAVVIGTGATAVMDVWTVARKRLFAIRPADYGLVGRWLVYLTRGRFAMIPLPPRRRCQANASSDGAPIT